MKKGTNTMADTNIYIHGSSDGGPPVRMRASLLGEGESHESVHLQLDGISVFVYRPNYPQLRELAQQILSVTEDVPARCAHYVESIAFGRVQCASRVLADSDSDMCTEHEEVPM